jgi:hypothetical protein
MAVTFRQRITGSETSAGGMTLLLPSDPLVGSMLIAAVGVMGTVGVTRFRVSPATEWQLLYEHDGLADADSNPGTVRVQLWGAFNIPAINRQIGVSFGGGTTHRGVIVSEYTGETFQFDNPADRVSVGSGQTAALTVGTLLTALGGESREAVENWSGAGAANVPGVTFQNPGFPFVIRSQIDIGNPAAGRLVFLNANTSAKANAQLRVDHTADAGIVKWAAAMAAVRGILQGPAEVTEEPVAQEPVTEQDDYSGNGIDKLISQLRARA